MLLPIIDKGVDGEQRVPFGFYRLHYFLHDSFFLAPSRPADAPPAKLSGAFHDTTRKSGSAGGVGLSQPGRKNRHGGAPFPKGV